MLPRGRNLSKRLGVEWLVQNLPTPTAVLFPSLVKEASLILFKSFFMDPVSKTWQEDGVAKSNTSCFADGDPQSQGSASS